MKKTILQRGSIRLALIPSLMAAIICLSLAPSAWAAVSSVPLFLTKPQTPIAVIDMPKGQSLFKKAYNDYSDVNDDGKLDITYDDGISYYGYFDTGLCYQYSVSGNRFNPAYVATGTNSHYCNGNAWSGNFLNWVSMSRMDVLRKILYGGKRQIDTGNTTVLDRAYLPSDAHAWAKYYDGGDINQLTPFNPSPVTQTTSNTAQAFPSSYQAGGCDSGPYAKLTFTVAQSIFYVGDQVTVAPAVVAAGQMSGEVCATATNSVTIRVDKGASSGTAGKSYPAWVLTDLSRQGVSFCNVTSGSGLSQGDTSPPLLRVAAGDYALWSANEKWQCRWSEQSSDEQGGFSNGFRSNGNRALFSGLGASAENPSQQANGLGDGYARGEYEVAIEVCDQSLSVNETCTTYPNGDSKPTGLLQKYGDKGDILFALFSGSYNKNYSGGVLRANAENFGVQEDNFKTDGTFTGGGGIVNTLDKLRIFGFDYNSANHYGSGDNCTYQLTDPLANPGEGNCRSWGNPMSEIYLDSLRYLAGKQATAAFQPSSSVLGLKIATWNDPVTQQNYCAPLNVLAFNTTASYDDDQMSGLADLGASKTAQQLTDDIGAVEGINGNSWFIGNTPANASGVCTAKNVPGLGDVNGLCPAAPSLHGSYLMDGAAWYAHTHQIRSDLTVAKGDNTSLHVKTYGVQLATNVPKIQVPVGGSNVTIQPTYRLDKGSGQYGSGTLVDFKVISKNATSGRFYVNWEDSNQGGDFDQDVWGILSYTVSGGSITVATDVVSASTSSPQGFGYTITGTTADGPHFTSGIYTFNYNDPTGVAGCQNCQIEDPPASVTYQTGTTAGGTLQVPLYYAAKWGGFDDQNSNDEPDINGEWDQNGDGQPDNYFYATNPQGLVTALNNAFVSVVQTKASAASAAANSTQLQTGTYIYQGRFSSIDWHGELLAYKLNPLTGAVPASPDWDAGQVLPSPANRRIFTFANDGGAGFAWNNLSLQEHLALALPTNTTTISNITSLISLSPGEITQGQKRLNYLRGDRSGEGTTFRTRNKNTVLGDIVHSNPVYVGDQDYGYANDTGLSSGAASSYKSYVATKASRMPMLYVGANDGMLHGFDVGTGVEQMAYIPQGVYPRLSALTQPSYNSNHEYVVDGSPTVTDAYIGGDWGTYLVGSLGAGGRGVFALDVGSPGAFSNGDVLWEFSKSQISTQAGPVDFQTPATGTNGYTAQAFSNLGYSIPPPIIARLNNGDWVAMVANGYGSPSGTAALYIINLADGKLIRELDTGYTGCAASNNTGCTGSNGLSSPFPVDVNNDGVADYVYAGDLNGNLWRFDLGGSDPSKWSVTGQGNSPMPLFVACSDAADCDATRQPITEQPQVGAYPSGGVMIYFGTGKYFEVGDQKIGSNPQTQSFYGIRDRSLVVGDAGKPGTLTTVQRGNLLVQQFLGAAGGQAAGKETARIASDTDIKDSDDGWVIDLPLMGERQVSNSILSRGRIIFTTLVPNSTNCGSGGDSFLIELNAYSGGRLHFSPFDLNHDQQFTSDDSVSYTVNGNTTQVPPSAIKLYVGIVSTPTMMTQNSKNGGQSTERKYLSGSSGNIQMIYENPGPSSGLQSWRQLR